MATAALNPEEAANHMEETTTVCGVTGSGEYEANDRTSRRYWASGGPPPMRPSPRSPTAIIARTSAPLREITLR